MKIIPAIDLIDGKCVRLTKGDYSTRKVYNEDPLEVAKSFEDCGIQYLHLVDLDGARSGHLVNGSVLERIATNTGLQIDFGGGLKSTADVETALNAGARQITGGSIAVSNRDLFLEWLEAFGAERVILGADSKDRCIATQGWLTASRLDVIDFVSNYEPLGVRTVIATDIASDGMLQGPAFALYRELIEKTKMGVIASGGVSSIDDLVQLRAIGCEGAIVGKAIYEGKITLQQLAELC